MSSHHERHAVRRWRRQVSVVTAIALALLLGSAASASDRACVSTHVDAPLLLPDGSLHDSGVLTLCHSRSFSPVSSLHTTYVNGMPIGMLLSRKRPSEGGSTVAPIVLFHRNDSGHLELFGYVLPGREAGTTYVFGHVGGISRKHRDLASASRQPRHSRPLVALAALSPR